jgi:hypothetical protein
MAEDYRQTPPRAIKNHEAVMNCLCICGLSPFSDAIDAFHVASAGAFGMD